jgi:hypothetical protein
MNGTDSTQARAFTAIGASAFTKLSWALRILWSTTHAESLFEHDDGPHVQAPDMILIKHSSVSLGSVNYLFGWDSAPLPPEMRARLSSGTGPGVVLCPFSSQRAANGY